jgi:hypothetical protein
VCYNYGHTFKYCISRSRPRFVWQPKPTSNSKPTGGGQESAVEGAAFEVRGNQCFFPIYSNEAENPNASTEKCPVETVIEPPKLTAYYHINHSFWSLRNSTELTCRLCRVKPCKSLVTKDRQPYIKTHTKGESRDKQVTIYYINSHEGLFNYKPSLFHKSKLFRVDKYSGNKTKR